MTGAPAGERDATKGMAWVPGGTFTMGSERHYAEEAPVREVTVSGFWMDEHPVTNLEFARFVKATGHVTGSRRRSPRVADARQGTALHGSTVGSSVLLGERGIDADEIRLLGVAAEVVDDVRAVGDDAKPSRADVRERPAHELGPHGALLEVEIDLGVHQHDEPRLGAVAH